MPCKNAIKQYVEGGYYHIYNRGVDKRTIFEDKQDYAVFLRFLKEYLLPAGHHDLDFLRQLVPKRNPINCSNTINLLSYCLMPNHFHLFVKQITGDGMKTFMKALATNYVMYFNRKHDRVGHLFQGIYKASLIQSEPYLLQVSRYIHANPLHIISKDQSLRSYPYSSYAAYLGDKNCEWVNADEILNIFHEQDLSKSRILYERFVEEDLECEESKNILGEMILE